MTEKDEIKIDHDSFTESSKLLWAMEMSLHPPHAVMEGITGSKQIVPNAAFPFCFYSSETVGTYLDDYKEHYCNAFKPTFNEHGLCYTFNNPDRGLDDVFQEGVHTYWAYSF